ncbi:MAG TPA: cytochrome c biogenesis protein CcsA [Bacteroidales bacterium]|nr:cytochrome c biogenesis protein CcsA [Bacteroidales bacterium]
MEIQYFGEHLLPGIIGRTGIILAFFASILAAFFYFMASSDGHAGNPFWRRSARMAFLGQGIGILVSSAALFYLLINRYYEYRYVWLNVENNLELGYQIAAFWAGQEGSLLFWILCQVVFGGVLIRVAKTWESPVMAIVSLSQVFMISMLLGWRLGSINIGLDPFLLLRQSPDFADEELFQNPHYISFIVDGNGLNPLLRNFWMLSHPPVLFVGFAAILIPFAYAVAGLWKQKYHEWIKPALPWTLLGVFFLGAGLMLGGVWAYESLTFGGFWAWDPIENASLVPWLVLLASLHCMLISQKTKNTFFPAFLFTILSFILVVYSTFLTRSGLMAETSVHSFGDHGKGGHIMTYIIAFLILGLSALVLRYRKLPPKDKEVPFTREFWLFIGALVLVLSAFQIIFTTSIPVYNKLLGLNLAPPIDVVSFYNTWQLPFGIAIALLIGVTHFIKWGKNDSKKFIRSISLSLILALIGTILIYIFYRITIPAYLFFVFAAMFALFSSLDLVLRFHRQYVTSGAAITHLGVGMFLLAIMLTFSKKQVISENTSGYHLGEGFPANENLLLIRDEILPMGDYYVTYQGKRKEGVRYFYQIDFLQKNDHGEYFKAFSSFPAIQINDRMGNVYEPYANVFPLRDVFTYVTFADLPVEGESPPEETLLAQVEISINDTIHIKNNHIEFKKLEVPGGVKDPFNIRIVAQLEVTSALGEKFEARPVFELRNGVTFTEEADVRDLDLRFRFSGLSEQHKTIMLDVIEVRPDFIIIKTTIFPFINLLWFSSIVIMVGVFIALRHRWKQSRVNDGKG